MTLSSTTTRATGAAVAALAALLIGGSGDASAPAPQPSLSQERVISNNADGSVQLSLGRNQRCPSGWLCLYEHAFFNRNEDGRMLKFKDNRWQQLSARGFNDKTSSWKNNLGRTACLSKDWPPGNDRLPLGRGSAAQMGTWGDEASGVKAGRC